VSSNVSNLSHSGERAGGTLCRGTVPYATIWTMHGACCWRAGWEKVEKSAKRYGTRSNYVLNEERQVGLGLERREGSV
jgi:hypothetical protein